MPPIVAKLLASRRAVNALGLVGCAAVLSMALYSQFVLGLMPCPLCIFQRIAMFALGAVFLLAVLHGPRGWGTRVYALGVLLAAGCGAAIAARHVWLIHLPPDQVPACGPGLDYLLDVFPLTDVVRKVLTGSGECAKVDWTLLGMAMPTWSLLAFMGLGVGGLWNNLRRN